MTHRLFVLGFAASGYLAAALTVWLFAEPAYRLWHEGRAEGIRIGYRRGWNEAQDALMVAR